jgi:hypothetical protein
MHLGLAPNSDLSFMKIDNCNFMANAAGSVYYDDGESFISP